jgi:hypothetical protein
MSPLAAASAGISSLQGPGFGSLIAQAELASSSPGSATTPTSPGFQSLGLAGEAGSAGTARGQLATPKWAAKLASKAQRGLNRLRDSLQEQG